MKISPLHKIDFYKISHKDQYPENTTLVYSNWTARSDKLSNLKMADEDAPHGGVVFFGLMHMMRELVRDWNENFFGRPLHEVISQYKRRIKYSLGSEPNVDHIVSLHKLGYLPIEIDAIDEGTIVPIGIPMMVIQNFDSEKGKYFWLTNYLETYISSMLWKPCTSATTSAWYKMLAKKYASITCDDESHVPFQFHDFSYRGMSGTHDAAMSGAGHLLSFVGTDTVPAIDLLECDYDANCEIELIGASVPATEHSVMSMGTQENEIDTFKRLINKIYPSGIVSIVSDTWDFWKVVTEYLPELKNDILSRDGKVVIRPDSGDPVKIICGDHGFYDGDHTDMTPQYKGAIECLWDTFGGTINSKGYKVLNPKIGLIYGDSITPERAKEIFKRLEEKGFASSNVVFGIGSYTFQHVTRDTYGFAIKATYGEIGYKGRDIFKSPKTDSGTKKSLSGRLYVYRDENSILRVKKESERTTQECIYGEGIFQPAFELGEINSSYRRRNSLSEIRNRLENEIKSKIYGFKI